MQIRLACADFTFPLLEHDRVLDLIAMLDLDGVDIGLFEGRSHLWPSREFENTGRSARRLGKKLAERGLRAADVYLQTNPDFVPYAINHPQASRRRRARDWFLQTLDYAAGCGAGHVSALPGTLFPRRAESGVLESRLRRAGVARGARGGAANRLWHRGAYRLDRPQSPPTGAIGGRRSGTDLDPGLHAFHPLGHSRRRRRAADPARPTHFHARGARKGRLQTSFQANTIDYARILAAMRTTGYGGYLGIEYVWTEWERCNEVDNLSETIRFRDFFRTASNSGPAPRSR